MNLPKSMIFKNFFERSCLEGICGAKKKIQKNHVDFSLCFCACATTPTHIIYSTIIPFLYHLWIRIGNTFWEKVFRKRNICVLTQPYLVKIRNFHFSLYISGVQHPNQLPGKRFPTPQQNKTIAFSVGYWHGFLKTNAFFLRANGQHLAVL